MEGEARGRARRHRNLLQDYLELQKEFVMKKKQCESLKNRRATLAAEVRFLRRRHQQLLHIQTANKKLLDFLTFHSSNVSLLQDNDRVQAREQLVGKTYLTTDLHPILASVIRESRSMQALQDSFLMVPNKKAKTCSTNEKGKRRKRDNNMARSGATRSVVFPQLYSAYKL